MNNKSQSLINKEDFEELQFKIILLNKTSHTELLDFKKIKLISFESDHLSSSMAQHADSCGRSLVPCHTEFDVLCHSELKSKSCSLAHRSWNEFRMTPHGIFATPQIRCDKVLVPGRKVFNILFSKVLQVRIWNEDFPCCPASLWTTAKRVCKAIRLAARSKIFVSKMCFQHVVYKHFREFSVRHYIDFGTFEPPEDAAEYDALYWWAKPERFYAARSPSKSEAKAAA